jgi:transcriptional regulator
MTAVDRRESIPQGTLDMLILQILERQKKLHGFEIAEAIEDRSGQVFQVEEGSLYPALQRLLVKGLICGEWGRTADNRRARYYRLTVTGRKQLVDELSRYRRVCDAIAKVLERQPVGSNA